MRAGTPPITTLSGNVPLTCTRAHLRIRHGSLALSDKVRARLTTAPHATVQLLPMLQGPSRTALPPIQHC